MAEAARTQPNRLIGRCAAALLVWAIAGCAGPTGYTKAGSFGGGVYGYSDKRISEAEFAITVTASQSTSKERAADIALLRAARLAEEQNRASFVILAKSSQGLERYSIVNVLIGMPMVSIPVGETRQQEPHAVLIIRLLPNDQPPSADALKAADVIAKLGPLLD